MMDGQQLDGGDTQATEMIEGGRGGEGGVGAAELWGNLRMTGGEPLDVHLVDDRLVPWCPQELVVTPREGRFHHHALGHEGRAVASVRSRVGAKAEEGVAPLDL